MHLLGYEESFETPWSAQTAFRRAHRRAFWQTQLGRFVGRPTRLCSFEEARKRLGAVNVGVPTLRDISLEQVVGSVGRSDDYTPTFLPRKSGDETRWIRVRRVINGMGGLPPISVYRLDGRYFIKDGHHRVSVLRQLGVKRVEAWVTEMRPVVTQRGQDEARALRRHSALAGRWQKSLCARPHDNL